MRNAIAHFVMACSLAMGMIITVGSLLAETTAPPNVLFIAVDDLRVELGCYDSSHVKSPNIDRLASQGTLFRHAYCQQTVCNPSRASVLTGMRPDTLRVWDLPTHFRQHHPDAVTLPQLFKQHGYHAQCVGKIFHNWRQDKWQGDEVSWSVPSVLHYNSHNNDKPQVDGDVPPNLASGVGGLECRDVPDNAYFDGRVAQAAIDTLRRISQQNEPFFLAVGFWKPHTPFNAPKKYWNLYDRDTIPIPQHVTPPKDVPEIALTSARYRGGADAAILREMQHGHLAAISYLDTQVGRVIDELHSLGLRKNTIIVFWSDHGLHVGEHGLTAKTTAFELDAAVPLLICTPDHQAGQATDALVELLDLYPTLTELCGIKSPAEIEGLSLVPLLENPKREHKAVALTQTLRPNYLRGELPEVMGYSIRNHRYRYTQWREFSSGVIQATELYDHAHDPLETVNLSGVADQQATLQELSQQLDLTLPTQPDPITNPTSALMLDLPQTGIDPSRIDYEALPRVPSQHAMISDVRDRGGKWVHQHAYLTHHDGRYWAMWSDGPGVPRTEDAEAHRNRVPGHDQADTRVSFATSVDGLSWSKPSALSGPPRIDGFGWIARGFWVRDGELLALASHFRAPGYPGKGLSLEAFRWNRDRKTWEPHGTVRDDAMNNFPPKRLPSGQYMMTRRDHQQQVSVMVGGEEAYNQWKVHPLASYDGQGRPEEPYWYVLPDQTNIVGLIRDNGRSGRLLRTFSRDNGQTWTPITQTNFPDATSKFFVLRTSQGYYAMVSNSNPNRRDPLTLAISRDGLVFNHLFFLVGGRHIDYPHIIEHDNHLLIAFSGAKQTMEVIKVSLDDLGPLIAPTPESLTYRHIEVDEMDQRVTAITVLREETTPTWARDVSQQAFDWSVNKHDDPFFAAPTSFVLAPTDEGEPFFPHNHQPSITWLANGDLLAIWYSTRGEKGTELTVLASRRRAGSEQWDPASEFFKAADHNMHGSSIFHDGQGSIYHFNGMAPKGGLGWAKLALLLRSSHDNGLTWTPPHAIDPRMVGRHQVISGTLMTKEGVLIQNCDAVPGPHGGTALHLSHDGGKTWVDPGAGKPQPSFTAGGTGEGTIAGIHAKVIELDDGRLLALGRGDSIDGKMPMSLSTDLGKTWTYQASPFPPIGGGQRLVLKQLHEGPLLLVSFTSGDRKDPESNGMTMIDQDGNEFIGHGMYAALSFDQGKTWPVRKLLTPGEGDFDGGAHTSHFTASPTRGEHAGYLAATQTPDNVIHLISSRLHYRFNLGWLLEGELTGDGPVPSEFGVQDQLPPLARKGQHGYVSSELIYPLTDKPTPQCHSSTIVETPAGLVAAWFGGTNEPHIDNSIWLARHVDGKWQTPLEVVDGSEGLSQDHRTGNPVLFQPRSGPLMLFYKVVPLVDGGARSWWGMMTISHDAGQTWAQPWKLGENETLGERAHLIGPVKNKPIELADGTIVCPSSTEHDGWRVHFELTRDFGKTWDVIGPIEASSDFNAIQPSILSYPDGRLQILCRSKENVIVQSWSQDNGKTWSPLAATALPNPNSGTDAVTLADGRQLMVYNHTIRGGDFPANRNMLNIAISRDGQTWQPIMTLERDRGEYSYPAVIQTSDGKIHLTYTWKRESIKHVVLDPQQLNP